MIYRDQLLERIDIYLSILKYYINFQNKKGLFNINKVCETFILDLLNLVYKFKLADLNKIKHNHPAIDLGDKNAKVCVQVTSTNDSNKFQNALKDFEEHQYYSTYNRFIFLLLSDKREYTFKPNVTNLNFNIDKDIIDFNDLVLYMSNYLRDQELEQVNNFFKSNFRMLEDFMKGQIEKTDVRLKEGTNYTRFLSNIPKEDIENAKYSIIKFSEKLERLRYETRQFLTMCIKNGENEYGEISVNLDDIIRRYYDEDRARDEINILVQKELIRVSDDRTLLDEICCYINDYEMFSWIDSYCSENDIDIRLIITELQFNLLD
jgi:hypothetical protein